MTAKDRDQIFLFTEILTTPSGDPTPSESDILLTKRVKDAGDLIGITLLDHIIIGNNCYVSFSEMKMM